MSSVEPPPPESKKQVRSGGRKLGPIKPEAEPSSRAKASVKPNEESHFFEGSVTGLVKAKQDLGYLGRFFGASNTAPTSIAGAVILIAIASLLISLWLNPSADLTEFRKTMKDIIILALGYLFGAATKASKKRSR